jgi:hypothetical protein
MIYEILDSNNIVVNAIVADAGFMQSHYPEGNYRERIDPAPEQAQDGTVAATQPE